jgi:hypothetical protein
MFSGNWVVFPPIQDWCCELFFILITWVFGVSNNKKWFDDIIMLSYFLFSNVHESFGWCSL